MRTLKNILLLSAVSVFALTSCSDDKGEKQQPFGDKPVTFGSFIEKVGKGGVDTRVDGSVWENDAIGVYMLPAGQGIGSALAENKHYSTPSTGNFSYVTDADKIILPADGSNVDFIAYYPYQATVTGNALAVNVADQSADLDIMYSNNATGINKNSTDVELRFKHMYAKLIFNVVDKSGEGLTGLGVTVEGLPTTASFSLANGNFENISGVADIVAETDVTSASAARSEAVIIPQTAGAFSVVFATAANTFEPLEIPAGKVYQSGYTYTYVINLNGDGTVEILNPDGEIDGWENSNEGEFDLNPEGNAGTGTESNPFTVDQVAANVGQSGVWVKGYIVGTTMDTRAYTDATSIAIAASPAETDRAKWVAVELEAGSDIQKALNLVDNEQLFGQQISVEGSIEASTAGFLGTITALTAQKGGIDPGAGEELEFFETFGTGAYTSNPRPKIADFDDFDMKAPIVYSDQYGYTDIRSTSTMNAAVWFPATRDAELNIAGIETGYTGMTLEYDIAAQLVNTNASVVEISANGTKLAVQPEYQFAATNTYYHVTLDLPDNTTEVTFFASSENNTANMGFRVDNIKISGTK